MILRKLTKSDKSQAIAGHNELAKENWEYLLKYEPEMNWEQYLELLDNESKGINLASDQVQATFLIAEVNGTLVGRTSIRHSLNDFLFNAGGHIGYGVRPEFRGKGHAKEILRQSLKFIQDAGVTRALLTCSDNNIASTKVIESQGGVLENLVEHEGTLKRRYWIDLSHEKKNQKLA